MKKKIYFVLGSFPVISHPFLYNQIQEVINLHDYDVNVITFNRTGEKGHDIYSEIEKKLIVLPIYIGNRSIARFLLIIRSFFYLLTKSPKILIKSLNSFRYSTNSRNFTYMILSSYFLKIDADIFHCHFGPVAKIVGDLKNIGAIKAKIISSFHGADITVFPGKYGEGYYKRLYVVSDMFTGNSNFIISKMIDNGCPSDKIVRIPESLNIDQFIYRGEAPQRGLFNILTVGRMVEKKGYEYSLKAVSLLKKQGVKFVYNIIGDGPLRQDILNLSKDLEISKEVVFHGAMTQDKVSMYYKAAHVFLLPSVTGKDGDTEGQGLVLQEAQAIGVPVLATLHNGFPDSVIDGITGHLVPERDFNALFDRLMFFYNDVSKCDEMGKQGREFVEQKFDARIVVQDLVKVYDKL